jgi:hypothetical protein
MMTRGRRSLSLDISSENKSVGVGFDGRVGWALKEGERARTEREGEEQEQYWILIELRDRTDSKTTTSRRPGQVCRQAARARGSLRPVSLSRIGVVRVFIREILTSLAPSPLSP